MACAFHTEDQPRNSAGTLTCRAQQESGDGGASKPFLDRNGLALAGERFLLLVVVKAESVNLTVHWGDDQV